MIVEHGHTLSHYLMNFILYTLGAIALMYAAYGYTRRRLGLDKDKSSEAAATEAAAPSAPAPSGALLVESTLGLEENKTLYVVKAGNERFLIATSGDSTQCLSRLENEPVKVSASPVSATNGAAATATNGAAIPWFTELQNAQANAAGDNKAATGFSERVLQSLRWLAVSRSPKA